MNFPPEREHPLFPTVGYISQKSPRSRALSYSSAATYVTPPCRFAQVFDGVPASGLRFAKGWERYAILGGEDCCAGRPGSSSFPPLDYISPRAPRCKQLLAESGWLVVSWREFGR